MQYTIRNIPPRLDKLLRQRARMERKSLNEVTLEALGRAFGLASEEVVQRDLSEIAGSWKEDPETEAAFEAQRRIDPELWS